MNHVETWMTDDVEGIETKVNLYCKRNHLKPISISITYCQPFFVVALVVEEEGGDRR